MRDELLNLIYQMLDSLDADAIRAAYDFIHHLYVGI